MLSYQAISIIEHVHSRYFIHRDIKPDNFAVGKELSSLLYLIDFGLAKMFIDPETKKQIPMTARKKLTGTARYASVHALMGMEQSRRDDLESFAYVIVYLLSGTLPLQGIITKNKEEKYAMILDRKNNITSDELCKNYLSTLSYMWGMSRTCNTKRTLTMIISRVYSRSAFAE